MASALCFAPVSQLTGRPVRSARCSRVRTAPSAAFFSTKQTPATVLPPDVPRYEDANATSSLSRVTTKISNILRLNRPFRKTNGTEEALKQLADVHPKEERSDVFAIFTQDKAAAFIPPDVPREAEVSTSERLSNLVKTVRATEGFKKANLQQLQAAPKAVINMFTHAEKPAPLDADKLFEGRPMLSKEMDEETFAPEAAIPDEIIAAIRAEREREAEELKKKQRLGMFGI